MSTQMTVARPRDRDTYTVSEVARRLGVTGAHVYRMAATGELPRVKLGQRVLIPVDAYEAWLAGEQVA